MSDKAKDLEVCNEDISKVLFLSTSPEHVRHDDNFDTNADPCALCGLIVKFNRAIQAKNLSLLRRDLKVKTLKLTHHEVDTEPNYSTFGRSFGDEDDLNKDDEELITFVEVLDLLKIPVPEILKSKQEATLKNKKIPVIQTKSRSDEQEVRNTFLSYTPNKIIFNFCKKFTPEEVFAMKAFIVKQVKDDTDTKMIDALSVVNDQKPLETIPGFKDLVFFYLVLNLIKYGLYTRLHTNVLEHIIRGAWDDLPSPESRRHMEESVNLLRRYPLTNHPPGICIVFAMTEDRENGTVKDVQNVRKVFEDEFRYDVFIKMNPKRGDIKKIVTNLCNQRNMFYDSLVVWFLAHGDKTYLKVKDGEIHRREDLIKPFVDIEWLKNKPKLFFIQACAVKRGNRRSILMPNKGLTVEKDALSLGINGGEDWREKYGQHTDSGFNNSLANTLVSYATMWYQEAARNEEGSVYVNTLLEQLKKYGRTRSIEDVLREAHYYVSVVKLSSADNEGWKQSPYYECSLTKQFIFP